MSKTGIKIFAGVSACIVLSVFYVAEIYNVHQENIENQEVESNLLDDIKQARLELSDCISDLSDYVVSISGEDFVDPDVIDDARDSINIYKGSLSLGTRDVNDMGIFSTFKEQDMLRSSIDQNTETYNSLISSIDKINSLKDELYEYVDTQKLEIAKDYLSLAVSKAEDVLSELDSSDYSGLSELESLIDSANSLDTDSISSVNELSDKLDSAIDEANTYISQKDSVDSSINLGETKKQDIWYVSYIYSYHSYDLGNNLVKWDEGYFVAHDYTESGKMILSRPQMVVVDGTSYRYVSETFVPEGTEWGEVEPFVHQNNGIGFQTCLNGQYLILHYEPM